MKIVQVVTSAEWGGAQRHVYDLSRELRQMGHDVIVLYGVEGRLHELLTAAHMPVYQVPWLTRNIRPWQDFRALSAIRRQIEAFDPDIVHAHSSKAGVLVRMAMRKSSVPVIYTIHGLTYLDRRMPSWKRFVYRAVERKMLPLAQGTIAVSQRDLDDLIGRGGDKVTHLVHIPNGIEPFSESIPIPNVPVIGTITRLVPHKALDVLLNAVAEVRKVVPNVQLIVVGDGPLRTQLEHQARELGIDDITRFAGFQTNVVEWLARMRVFALTSVKEGMPYALLEAIASGRVVVANDIGTLPETLKGEGVITVPVGDQDALIRGLIKGVTEYGSIPTRVVTTPHAMAKQVLEVYRQVLEI